MRLARITSMKIDGMGFAIDGNVSEWFCALSNALRYVGGGLFVGC